MLSVRRLFYVILMVLGICGMFLLSNINEKDTAIWSVKQEVRRDVEKKQKILKGENRDNLEKTEEVQFYILGDEKKEFYGDIYRNVCGLMEDLKVSWKKRSCIGDEELRDHKAVFIFCDDTLHLLRKYANGYARMSVMMVAITEYTTDKRNVSAYSESEVMFEKVKLPLSSVKA